MAARRGQVSRVRLVSPELRAGVPSCTGGLLPPWGYIAQPARWLGAGIRLASDQTVSSLGLPGLAIVLLTLLLPAGASAACATDNQWADLMRYVGTTYGDLSTTLDNDPLVQRRLSRLSPSVRQHLARNLSVRGPVDLVSCHLVLHGNAPHEGNAEDAILDIDLYSGEVTIALLSDGQITIYLDKDPATFTGYGEVPAAVRRWVALAAMGGDRLSHLPSKARIQMVPRSEIEE